jgi:hypothetical protein
MIDDPEIIESGDEPDVDNSSSNGSDSDIELESEVDPEEFVNIPLVTKAKKPPKTAAAGGTKRVPLTAEQKKENKRLSDLKYDAKRSVKVVEKTKLIYIMTDREGNEIERIDPAKMNSRAKKALAKEDVATAAEMELGMKLKRMSDGRAALPKKRTAAQLANDKKLGQMRKDRLAKVKVDEMAVKAVARKKSLIEALKDVVKMPLSTVIPPPPKEYNYGW